MRVFRLVIRDGIARLGASTWPAGRDIWSADAANRDLQVDEVDVGHGQAPDHVRALLGLDDSTTEVIRRATRHRRRRHLRSGAEARHTLRTSFAKIYAPACHWLKKPNASGSRQAHRSWRSPEPNMPQSERPSRSTK